MMVHRGVLFGGISPNKVDPPLTLSNLVQKKGEIIQELWFVMLTTVVCLGGSKSNSISGRHFETEELL